MSPPLSWSIMAFAAARATRNEPLAMTSCCRSQSRSVVSSSGFEMDSPALLTTKSIPPKASTVASTAACTASASVTSAVTARPPISEATSSAAEVFRSAIVTHAPSAASRSAMALPIPEPHAGHQGDPPGEGLGLRHPLQLGLFEGPVLDAELLALGDRGVRRDGLRATHDVDRVDVEFARHPGGLLVLAEGEHPDARDEHDRRVGAAHRGRVRGRVPLVVGAIFVAVLGVQFLQPRDDVLQRRGRREIHHQGPDLGAQEVVRAGRAERGQRRELLAGQEFEDGVAVGVVPDDALVGRGEPANHRRECGRACTPLNRRQGLEAGDDGAERLGGTPCGQELLGRADDVQGVALALFRGRAPGGDAVAAEDDADRLRVGRLDGRDVQPELEAGTPPVDPRDAVAEALLGQRGAVGRGG